MQILQIHDQLLLKPIQITDAKDIFNAIQSNRDYLGKWLPFVALTKELSFTENYIRSVVESHPDSSNDVFVIHKNGEFVGLIGLKDTDHQNKKTEIGYWIVENQQKQGIITLSVISLCEYAFHQLKLNRIQVKCAVENYPSKNIPQKLGFILERIERSGELLSDGKFTDLEVYSLLYSDYISLKENWAAMTQ